MHSVVKLGVSTGRLRRGSGFYMIGKTFFSQPLLKSKSYSTASPTEQYNDKLLKKAKQHGFQSIEELKDYLKEDINKKTAEFNRIDPLKELNYQYAKMSSNNVKTTVNRGPIDSNGPTQAFKTLYSYLNAEKIKELSNQEVEYLWRARWTNQENTLNAVIKSDVYDKIIRNVKKNPVFVLPLPREINADDNDKSNGDMGMELHYIQWQFVSPYTTHCIITSLAEYKLHNEFSRPHTIFQFHSELSKDRNIIFMNGKVESGSNISTQEAQLLLLNIQRFYGAMGEETPISKQRVKLLKDFTCGSSEFDVNTLISLSQSMEN